MEDTWKRRAVGPGMGGEAVRRRQDAPWKGSLRKARATGETVHGGNKLKEKMRIYSPSPCSRLGIRLVRST